MTSGEISEIDQTLNELEKLTLEGNTLDLYRKCSRLLTALRSSQAEVERLKEIAMKTAQEYERETGKMPRKWRGSQAEAILERGLLDNGKER